MKVTYSISEAQAKCPSVVRDAAEAPIAITRRDTVVGYLISTERMGAILETLELLGNPDAMKAIESAEQGGTRYRTLDELDSADQENAR